MLTTASNFLDTDYTLAKEVADNINDHKDCMKKINKTRREVAKLLNLEFGKPHYKRFILMQISDIKEKLKKMSFYMGNPELTISYDNIVLDLLTSGGLDPTIIEYFSICPHIYFEYLEEGLDKDVDLEYSGDNGVYKFTAKKLNFFIHNIQEGPNYDIDTLII